MGRGRPIAPLALDGAERETLEQWTRRPKTAQALALRARIVLACADGRSNTGVAAELPQIPHLDKRKTSLEPDAMRAKMFCCTGLCT